jgi:histidine triad (HIT) family protein
VEVGTGAVAADCLFCRVVSGELPAKQLYADDLLVAVRDKHPRSPTHILLLPREHLRSAAEFTESHRFLLARIYTAAADMARRGGFLAGGYRITTNVGAWAGQSVDHLHFHLTAGKPAQ